MATLIASPIPPSMGSRLICNMPAGLVSTHGSLPSLTAASTHIYDRISDGSHVFKADGFNGYASPQTSGSSVRVHVHLLRRRCR